jgi:hypothetical protein
MQRMFLKFSAIALLINLAAYGQSLGEIARENREKQEAEAASGARPKPLVITNKDLPPNPEGYQPPREPQPGPGPSPFARSADQRFAEPRAPEPRMPEQRMPGQPQSEQWTRVIQQQESRMADLQARIDQFNARSMAGGAQPYNRNQARQQQHVAQMQQQLEMQRRRLEEMQEAARHAGMHTQVYDP